MATTIANDPAADGRCESLTAVTVTFNSADVLPDFLASVAAQRGNWSLIIVDNASTDGTRELLAGLDDPRIRVILSDRNGGFAAGTNIGIRAALAAAATSVLLLNNDTVFGPDLFEQMERRLTAYGADAISPVIVFDHDPKAIWFAGGHLKWIRGVKVIHDRYEQDVDTAGTQPFKTLFCPACCMLFSRAALERVGLLDEDFFVYWEDAEHSLRMEAAGMVTMVDPDMRVRHKASALTGGMNSEFSTFQQSKNRVILLRKAATPLTFVYSVAVITAISVGRLLLKAQTLRAMRVQMRGMLAGLKAPLVWQDEPDLTSRA